MDSTTANSPTSFSTATRNTAPAALGTAHAGAVPCPAQDAQSHQLLLSCFPAALQADIAQDFPTLQTLQVFHDDLRDNDIALDRIKPVARMLQASRDAREVESTTLAQARELRFHHGVGVDTVNRRNSEGATSLHLAILCFNRGKVEQLLASGARLDLEVRPTQRRSTFIAVASLAKKLNVTVDQRDRNTTIIEAMAPSLDSATTDISTRVLIEHAGENALTLAIAYEAPLKIVAMLVKHCAQHCPQLLQQADANGNPPLLLAAASHQRDAIDIVRLLRGCGAVPAIDQTNALQRTALMEAARRGDALMVALLLQAGASCMLTDNHGYTATAHAVLCGWPTLHKLMVAVLDLRATGQQASQLNERCLGDFVGAIYRGQVAVVSQMLTDQKQRLLGTDATLSFEKEQWFDGFSQEGLIAAIQVAGNGAVIRFLTGQAAADLPDGAGVCPWQKAIDKEAFEALLAAVCTLDATPMDAVQSQAMLALAAHHGSVRYASVALNNGADIEALDPTTGCNALMMAVNRNERLLIVELLGRGASILGNAMAAPGNALATPLPACALATAQNLAPVTMAAELAVFIVEHCPDPYRQPHHAGLLLDFALQMKLPALATRLIKDSKLEPRWFQHRPKSLLLEVVEAGSTEFAAALLHPQAPLLQLLNADNGNADQALALASTDGKRAIFHCILTSCNIDPTTPPALLRSRLMLAVAAGCSESCELILTQGSLRLPPAAPAADNPLILAVQLSHHHLIPLLLHHGAHACAQHGQKASALSRAIAANDDQAVTIMLPQDSLPAQFAEALPQLLRKAVAGGNGRAFEMLIERSAQLSLDVAALSTMLQQAVTLGSLAACTVLLERGADPGCTTAEGWSLLALALLSPRPSLPVVRLLFENKKTCGAIFGKSRYPGSNWHAGLDLNKIAEALSDSLASEAQIIEWTALMFCLSGKSFFTAFDDMAGFNLRHMLTPLRLTTSSERIDAMRRLALLRAVEIAKSMPDPDAVLHRLERIAHVLDLPM